MSVIMLLARFLQSTSRTYNYIATILCVPLKPHAPTGCHFQASARITMAAIRDDPICCFQTDLRLKRTHTASLQTQHYSEILSFQTCLAPDASLHHALRSCEAPNGLFGAPNGLLLGASFNVSLPLARPLPAPFLQPAGLTLTCRQTVRNRFVLCCTPRSGGST